MSDSSAVVRSWVAGYSAHVRERRWLVVLQAYIDDSKVFAEPVSVIAGWVANADRWSMFTDEWDETLAQTPAIEYFKMSEAANASGCFYGWNEEEINKKIALLHDVIMNHVTHAVSVTMLSSYHKQEFAGLPSDYRNPYLFMGQLLIQTLARAQMEANEAEGIEVIFDRQKGQEAAVVEAWEQIYTECPDDIRPFVDATPHFADDKKAKPLQAADLRAWWQRRLAECQVTGQKPRPFPWKEDGREILNMHQVLGVRELDAYKRGIIDTAFQNLERRAATTPWIKFAQESGISVTLQLFPDEAHPKYIKERKRRIKERNKRYLNKGSDDAD